MPIHAKAGPHENFPVGTTHRAGIAEFWRELRRTLPTLALRGASTAAIGYMIETLICNFVINDRLNDSRQ